MEWLLGSGSHCRDYARPGCGGRGDACHGRALPILGQPAIVGFGLEDFDLGTGGGTREQAEGERKNAADQELLAVRLAGTHELQLSIRQAVELKLPGIAIDKEQFADA